MDSLSLSLSLSLSESNIYLTLQEFDVTLD